MTAPFHFDDGAAYERFMGRWSRPAGEAFLRWLSPPPRLRWLDVGCGNGAFTELLVERCDPASVHGIDPSAEQLAFARARPGLAGAVFRQGDGQALPYQDAEFDAAVMPLVLFFLADPARGVREMVRVVGAGGFVAAYVWDMPGGGFPYLTLHQALNAVGIEVPSPPSPEVSDPGTLDRLWREAGLERVGTTAITVERTFADFADYWATVLGAPSVGGMLRAFSPEAARRLEAELRVRLPFDSEGRIRLEARANAVRGVRR